MRAAVARRHFFSLHGQRVAELILDFLETTQPARITAADMRDVMRTHRSRRRKAS